MPPRPKANKKVNPRRCAALYTHVDRVLIIRANPTVEAVKGFVLEHNRRYHKGEPGGPSGLPAFRIHRAAFFDDEMDAKEGFEGEEIDLSDVLPSIEFPATTNGVGK